MQKEVMGVPLQRLEDPIQVALLTYQEISQNALQFEINQASQLEPTPTLANSARSATDAFYQGVSIGKLYVIAFKPSDGTGAEVNYQLKDLQVSAGYPKETRIVPRQKTGVYHEGHLAIVTHDIENVHAEPELFAGTYDLLGLKDNVVTKIGELGHLVTENEFSPLATFTVGYRNDERFGDPHAVYNALARIQVCAFLAISNEINAQYPNILRSLNPQFPRS